ncbi:DUF2255 family protein [Streptomyces sp. NBC_01498]|uniref:DUF2255 family protein n=1 Tax=Streptomyces sp. NBC_01498 TaxID=2975870 RepID=UPI002E7AF99D|nr:DUF2255 family protein [Streptomyces sp. NBC_01498]WTL23294.1 DUF2255 family protein [Streptomyces sp. NBC_01498]
MATWTKDELNMIGRADELEVAPLKSDDTTRQPTTVWVVRDGDDLLVRAFNGRNGVWYRAATARHAGHISAGGVDKDVMFVEQDDPALNDRLDAAYRGKYGTYSEEYVGPMVADTARAATLKLVPR